ncbi:preprotein translocase subunit SecA [Alphaproteobacteria bacterium endosymbiont of Tiliacea citrago]|uniref:preprotein translocase subunit SecA n=1 Tax=Alphaproteobacteria bacterium endosymbiont of Tiliacea citrago TaxID=3077944 RepID=UPI00313B95D1
MYIFVKAFFFIWNIVWFIPSYFLYFFWLFFYYGYCIVHRLIYPDYNARKVKVLYPIIEKINILKDDFSNLSNADLKKKTLEFKERIKNGETLDDILVEAFATVKEASKRVLGLEHYDEQLMAAISLHRGCMTEMKTGEGKTLAATPAVYLNALDGKSVHVATVNDYLAKRDSDEMGRLYSFLGLTCGALLESMDTKEKQIIYGLDIVYATGSTLGFDYLYDNMSMDKSQIRQRGLDFVLVDEADKLIDDGRTPLIITNPSDDSLEYYSYLIDLVRQLTEEDYEIEKSQKSITFSEAGLKKINSMLEQDNVVEKGETLYSSGQLNYVHGLNQCLHAEYMLARNVDYIVSNRGEILLIDEHTGRILDGRRLSNGLHQAIEAKEGVRINSEGRTSASISYQKFFGLYQKFSGMSGTCLSEAEEFYEIYGVDTISIPTHKKVIRKDEDDEIYIDFEDKFNAIVKEVKEALDKQQPVLLITGSVEFSEVYAQKFKKLGWKFNVLNAKRNKEEADIIAQAGMPRAITIATNMAGRGTDIQLGGNLDMHVRLLREQGLSEAEIEAKKPAIKSEIKKSKDIVLKAGGLFVIGTERNESRRVDDQARGRAGRQGDPGRSKFMISLDDPLMKNFSNQSWLKSAMTKGEPIYDPWITRQVEKAQKMVEARSFDQRKYLIKYDGVMDEQRTMIYEFRNKYLFDDDLTSHLEKFVREKLNFFEQNTNSVTVRSMSDLFGVDFSFDNASEVVVSKMKDINMKSFKTILLTTLDDLWSSHLLNLSYIKQITELRAHGQKDPLTEYKIEASKLFENLLERFVEDSLYKSFHLNETQFFENSDGVLVKLNSLIENLESSLNSVEDEASALQLTSLLEQYKKIKNEYEDNLNGHNTSLDLENKPIVSNFDGNVDLLKETDSALLDNVQSEFIETNKDKTKKKKISVKPKNKNEYNKSNDNKNFKGPDKKLDNKKAVKKTYNPSYKKEQIEKNFATSKFKEDRKKTFRDNKNTKPKN